MSKYCPRFWSSRWSQNRKSKMQSFFKFPLNISVSPPSYPLSLYTGRSCFAPAGGPRIENPKCNRFSSFLSISLLLLPPLPSIYILIQKRDLLAVEKSSAGTRVPIVPVQSGLRQRSYGACAAHATQLQPLRIIQAKFLAGYRVPSTE